VNIILKDNPIGNLSWTGLNFEQQGQDLAVKSIQLQMKVLDIYLYIILYYSVL